MSANWTYPCGHRSGKIPIKTTIKGINMRHIIVGALVALTLSGCAKQAVQIPAIPVAGAPYASFSCNQMSSERVRLGNELSNLSAAQSSAVTGDTIGVLLIGIPVSSMSGNDLEGQIGANKGAAQALELEISRKSC
jgi:type IV pilus biogenesis protein CpaD/CtpE